ncbi:hypothetical protein B0T16DRAFT_395547 [Cercophora newfieldiana]|uniref:Uncharacterized protein n=1 Tax=Cercophora newfieldiana TaxID=92897 RepID=A0AA40CJJ5_9PEZI|nr:hypothetical protein B0T16DRAFT_395547 [Cercophora newfieldiana]
MARVSHSWHKRRCSIELHGNIPSARRRCVHHVGSRDGLVVFGKRSIDFVDLTDLIIAYKILRLVVSLLPEDVCQHVSSLRKSVNVQKKFKSLPLIETLRITAYAQSSDPRDKSLRSHGAHLRRRYHIPHAQLLEDGWIRKWKAAGSTRPVFETQLVKDRLMDEILACSYTLE